VRYANQLPLQIESFIINCMAFRVRAARRLT
jgi:hypothetical protein